MNVVERFIHKFKQFDKSGEVVKTFTEGYCYYFACILCERFKIGTIWYSEKDNHFAARIGSRLYDITGDITSRKADFIPWHKMQEVDSLVYARLVRDCVRKL